VAGDDRIRLFCALQLPDAAVDGLAAWQARHLRTGAPGVRIVEPGQLHITLAFLGSRPVSELPRIGEELGLAAAAAGPVRLQAERYRETRSVGMIVFCDAGEAAAALAADLGERLERIGVYRREQRPWLPHVTVSRFRVRPRLELPPPELGEVSPSDAAVYSSVLRPTGARYDVLERFALRSANA
jgi:RNA 2',3'-cyclic 3'-phosphodiesterase